MKRGTFIPTGWLLWNVSIQVNTYFVATTLFPVVVDTTAKRLLEMKSPGAEHSAVEQDLARTCLVAIVC